MLKRDIKPSVVYWIDNILYLNITNKCPNNCYFCIKRFRNGIQEFNLKLESEPKIEEVMEKLRKVIRKKNWKEIVFCGFGEPLERLGLVLEVTRQINNQYRKTIRVNTNGQGYLLNKGIDVVNELKNAGVTKVSISLNAHNKQVYNQICKPETKDAYENVLDFIIRAKEVGLETIATAVRVPEVEITKVKEVAESLGVKFVLREYIPLFW
jgi:TatD family-associated radical SAM protein